MHINYDFADLEAFLAVKETGSFHLAAQKLALSQSAVSRRIQKLEAALDSALFERTTRNVRPTLAAKRLAARAEAILEDARETARAMRDDSVAYAHQRGLVITVALIPTLVSGLIATALAAYRAQGYRTRLRLLEFAANEVSEAVAQADADFGICSMPALEPMTDFEPLFDDCLVLTMPMGHRLAARGALSWRDLGDEDLILPGRRTGNRVLIDEALARAKATLRWTYETERATTALSLVEAGTGLALLPRALVIARGPAARLTWRPVADLDLARPVGLLSRTGQTDSAPTVSLKAAIRDAAALSQLDPAPPRAPFPAT